MHLKSRFAAMEDPDTNIDYRVEYHRLRTENTDLRAENIDLRAENIDLRAAETQMNHKYASLQRRYNKLVQSYKDIIGHWKLFKKRAGGSKAKYKALIKEEMPEARHSIAEYKKEQDELDSEASKLYDEFKNFQASKLTHEFSTLELNGQAGNSKDIDMEE